MDEKDWLLLQALRDTRNITKAAAQLNTTQPGLSRRLQMIEERFGVSIALRNKSGMEFTPEGEELLAYAEHMLEALRSVQERISDMGTEVTGTLRICASNYSISHILPKGLAAFKKMNPLVEYRVSAAWSSDVIKAVGSGEAHVGFISPLKKSEAAFFKEVWGKRGFAKPLEILLSLLTKFPVADSRRLRSSFFNGLLCAASGPPCRTRTFS